MTFQFYTRRKWAICGGLGFEDLTLMKNISCYTFKFVMEGQEQERYSAGGVKGILCL